MKATYPAELKSAGNARRQAIYDYEPCMWVIMGGKVVASFPEDRIEDAAALIAVLGDGAILSRKGGRILWAEGYENTSAADSYDAVAQIVCDRI